MPVDWKAVAGFTIMIIFLLFFSIGVGFVGYRGVVWLWSDSSSSQQHEAETTTTDTTAAQTPNIHTIYKKDSAEQLEEGVDRLDPGEADQATTDRGEGTEETKMAEEQSKMAEEQSKMAEAVVSLLTRKLERGEITLGQSCACASATSGGKNVTFVRHETRVEYRCLLEDKVRWAVMEAELKKTLLQELARELTHAREKGEQQCETHVQRAMSQAREETTQALTAQRERMTSQLEQRLREVDSRLALEPQVMEIRGFMKIDTFGPVLLAMGALEMLLMMCMCLMFLRQR